MFARALIVIGAACIVLSCGNDAPQASSNTVDEPTHVAQIAEPQATPNNAAERASGANINDQEEPAQAMSTHESADQDAAPVDAENPAQAVTPGPMATPEPTAAPEPTVTPEPTAAPEPTVVPPSCERLTDFAIDAQNLSWFIVNDNVMGGRSSGGPTFVDSSMVFEGEINTDGGGFSSVRVSLGSNALTGFNELVVRARTDGRSYKLTLEDSLGTRDRRVSQQGILDFDGSPEWQTARVSFAELTPKIFGRDVQSEPFRPDLATQLGVMISDGVDGPFRIEIDWIDACR